MDDNGSTKDDVKVPDTEIGEKILRMFREEEKDCSKCTEYPGWLAQPRTDLSRRHHPDLHG